MADRRELLAQMLQQGNVTTGAAKPGLKAPTGATVDRNRRLIEVLSQEVPMPQTQRGMTAPVEATQLAAAGNIARRFFEGRVRKKGDDQSRELLVKELEMMNGGDPFKSEIQPIESPVLSGRVDIRQGPGADAAAGAVMEGIKPFVEATEATRAGEDKARGQHNLAAILDDRAAPLAAQRLSATAPAWGDPEVDPATGAVVQRNTQTGEVREVSRPASQSGGNSRFGSPQITQSNRLITLDRSSGQYQYADSGEPWDSTTDPASADIKLITNPDGSVQAVDVRQGVGAGGNRTENVVSSADAIESAANRTAAETSAKEGAVTAAIPERTRVEAQAEDFAQAPLRLKAARDIINNVDQLNSVFDRVLSNAGAWTVGFGSIAKPPGSPAADMEADLNTIAANAAFDRLQQMRDSSPTGGALGQVSERELALLRDSLSALGQSQSPEQFVSNIESVRRNYQRIGELAQQAARMDSIKSRISSLQNRPGSPEVQSQIDGMQQRLFAEEDKLWSMLDQELDGAPQGGGLPDGITDDDVAFTMQKYGMTREQVLERLNAP